MERRTVDGVDKQRDAQRARSRASGAENNPINTTGDPAAAAGGHVGGRAKLWCGERAASGRVASSRPCHVVQRAISAAMFMGDPPKTFGIGFGLWTGRYKLLGLVTDVTDVRYGYCCLALQRFTFWKHDPSVGTIRTSSQVGNDTCRRQDARNVLRHEFPTPPMHSPGQPSARTS